MIPFDELIAEVARRRRERFPRVLEGEGAGRAPGRRLRDQGKEDLLLRLDRRRLEGLEAERGLRLRREVGGGDPGADRGEG